MNEQKKKLFRFCDGWVAGAAWLPISGKLKDDPDYAAGYEEGRQPRTDMKRRAEERYGVEFAVFKVC